MGPWTRSSACTPPCCICVTGPTRFAALVAASTLGSLLGESVGYLLGRRYGDRLRRGRLGRRLGEDAWAKAEAFLAGRGGRAVAAARFVAVVHALVPVVAGSVRMRYRRFLGWSVLGAVTWSVTLVGGLLPAQPRPVRHRALRDRGFGWSSQRVAIPCA